MGNEDIESGDEEFSSQRGRKYRPVVAHDRAVLEMSSMDPGSSSSSSPFPNHDSLNLLDKVGNAYWHATSDSRLVPHFQRNVLTEMRKIKVGSQENNFNEIEGSAPTHTGVNGSHRESKLELFGFDSLVNILGLKSMTGEQIQAPSSPRDGEEVSVTVGPPKGIESLKVQLLVFYYFSCFVLELLSQHFDNVIGDQQSQTGDNDGCVCAVLTKHTRNYLLYPLFLVSSRKVQPNGQGYLEGFLFGDIVLNLGGEGVIVGMAGIGESLMLVSFCGLCTFLTAISLSAIATNGAMKGGGPYYLISRALGPEVGVSIGLCFFLGNAVAGALYVLGAVETFLGAVPGAGIFGETMTKVNGTTTGESVSSPNLHDLQVYGIVVTIILCFIVFGGVKMINRVAPAFLIPVLFSLFCIYMGIFLAGKDHPATGITGLSLESFKNNWSSDYQFTNNAGIPDPKGSIYWNFNALVGLFFPAVTGIMAGSNRSASLKDTQRSIPVGTLAATLTTSAMYLISVLLFGALATRDKLLTDRLLSATVAWPSPVIIYIGIILSTLGAALQSLTGAPRVLAAIANDDILPVLNYFKVAEGNEPHVATLFTAFICIGCVIIGNLDLITPTITMFFLLCYAGVNLSCFLLDLLDAPSWRPRWKFHHWSLSLLGASLCLVIMFLISWSFTVVSLALAGLIYYYVSIKGKAGDWGDGFKSAYFQLALRSLRSLGASQVHPKNWYPIPLIFCRPWGKLPENVPCHPKLADFANCMKKKGRGMSIFVSILDGDYHECAEDAKTACRQLSTYIDYKRCEGVAEIVVAPSMSDGFRGIVQTMGLGNLKPNIVVMRYPEIWRRENLTEIPATFVGIINDCIVANKAVVIVKGLDEWPNEYQRQYGTIDLYWIVRDGGLMLLLSQLLLTKESFESCKIQVFCIAEEDSDAEMLKADIKKFLYDLRMQAEVIVISMKSWDTQVDGGSQQDDSIEAFTAAQRRIATYLADMKETAKREGKPLMADGKSVVVNEQQVEKFLYTTLKLNSTILRYSRMAAVVLVSLPPPPLNHPSYFYMEYMDLLVENVPRLLMVRGYRKDVVTLFT
ncbi:Amino acid permease/ SLC12A domain [Dillenia turbinata]|uniref:Amino acid permease/ SLC12A domain n=1 Tax=Dillenia turbinata TaxID=194707 RepID=A0AAN8VMA3_9MAGN